MSAVSLGGPSWDGESREFSLTCDATGNVVSVHARAAAKLKLRPADSFLRLAVPGIAPEHFARIFEASSGAEPITVATAS